jgi:ElaB/YqjD/DUF883 family membrane-anchored ribosome-binding protein
MKTKMPHSPTASHGPNGTNLDSVIASAKQVGRDARDAAVDQLVQPAVDAVRHAGHQIEHGYHEAVDYVGGRVKQVESAAAAHPMRTLACAVGVGVLIGLWLGRK